MSERKKRSKRIGRKKPPTPPTERQLRAFEHYFTAGDSRSYLKTAEHIGVSVVSISNWARKHGWEDKVKQRSLELEHQMKKETNRMFKNARQKFLAITKKAIEDCYIADAVGNIISVRFKTHNVQDFERLLKIYYMLSGTKLPDEETIAEDVMRGMDPDLVSEIQEELSIIIKRKYRERYNQPALTQEEEEAINRGED